MKSARPKFSTLQQVCAHIPGHVVAKLARKCGVDDQARSFSPWSHIVVLLYAQLSHAIGLNNVCDGMRMHLSKLFAIRCATPPARNTLSHANRVRSAQMAEELFWAVLDHCTATSPSFGGKTYRGFPRRFKRMIHVVDSSTIQLVANCMDWAKHRRRKSAAKLHISLNLQSFLPQFAIVDTAGHNDNKRARELCADIGAGEIVLFDKAYVDFELLCDLDARDVFWVTRAKDNLQYRVVKRRIRRPQGRILRDDEIVLRTPATHKLYPQRLRRTQSPTYTNTAGVHILTESGAISLALPSNPVERVVFLVTRPGKAGHVAGAEILSLVPMAFPPPNLMPSAYTVLRRMGSNHLPSKGKMSFGFVQYGKAASAPNCPIRAISLHPVNELFRLQAQFHQAFWRLFLNLGNRCVHFRYGPSGVDTQCKRRSRCEAPLVDFGFFQGMGSWRDAEATEECFETWNNGIRSGRGSFGTG